MKGMLLPQYGDHEEAVDARSGDRRLRPAWHPRHLAWRDQVAQMGLKEAVKSINSHGLT